MKIRNSLLSFCAVIACLSAALCITTPAAASSKSPRVLQDALATHNGVNLYDDHKRSGFSFSGGFFKGRASGVDPVGMNYLGDVTTGQSHFDRTAELEGDRRVYALMIDGKYDFNTIKSALRPYMSGGFGMAMIDSGAVPSAGALALQQGGMVPLVRIGGGVTYHMSESMDLSVDYKMGFSDNNNRLIGSGPQNTNLHVVNMGMRLSF